MIDDYQVTRSVFLSQVNFWLGTVLLLTVACGAALIIWHTATGLNPISDAVAVELHASE